MRKLLFAMLIGLAAQAHAQSICVEPPQPAPIDGATASLAQMQAATAAVKKYLADSDAFQGCLVNELAAIDIEHEATKAKALQKSLDARTLANQARKESAGADLNAAIRAFNARRKT